MEGFKIGDIVKFKDDESKYRYDFHDAISNYEILDMTYSELYSRQVGDSEILIVNLDGFAVQAIDLIKSEEC